MALKASFRLTSPITMGSRVEILSCGRLAFQIQKVPKLQPQWCAAHTTSNFDSDFTERYILPPEPKYTPKLPGHFPFPPELEKDSCHIQWSSRHKDWSSAHSIADGRTIKWENISTSFNFGSVFAVLAILGAIIYFGSVFPLTVFFWGGDSLRSTVRKEAVPEARSSPRAVYFSTVMAVWKSSCRRIKEAVIP